MPIAAPRSSSSWGFTTPDPFELTNVAADPATATVLATLHTRLAALLAE